MCKYLCKHPCKYLLSFILFFLLFIIIVPNQAHSAPLNPVTSTASQAGQRIIHPIIPLLDAMKQPVIDTARPISTRATCGGCHDYDFISQGFHFQQGRLEILKRNNKMGKFPYLVSSGMYGKWCSMPNRQLTSINNRQEANFDFGTPDWLRSCGTCHPGGGVGEFDRRGRKYNEIVNDSLSANRRSSLDPDYNFYSQKHDKVIPWDWQESGLSEVDCFLCHIPNFNREARDAQMRDGYFSWGVTATLLGTGIVKEDFGELIYNPKAFLPDKTVRPELLQLTDPGVDNCGQCHGFAKTGEKAAQINPFFSHELLRGTKKMGRIWSPAKIKDSELNLKDKEKMDFAWDVHAKKNLTCIDCHFSPDNPARNIRNERKEAKHLIYHPPTARWKDFLKRPDHNMAKGNSYPETVADGLDNSMRECRDCHNAPAIHQWLPYRELHFSKLACEVCHIPSKHYWACQQLDLTIYPKGISRYRGIIGNYKDLKSQTVLGFKPAYFLRKSKQIDQLNESSLQLVPANPISALVWFDPQNGRTAFPHQVRQAFYYWNKKFQMQMRPEVVKFFDKNQDGKVSDLEMRLDSPEKIAFAKSLIRRQGIKNPQLELEIVPFSLNHNIVGKGQAIKNCQECHSENSRLLSEVEIFDYAPPGIDEISTSVPDEIKGTSVTRVRDGKVFYASVLPDFYIMGLSRVPLIEWIGWLMVLIALVGSVIHGTCRIFGSKRAKQ